MCDDVAVALDRNEQQQHEHEHEHDSHEHDAPFNLSNGDQTAIENIERPKDDERAKAGLATGSDSGVEVAHTEYASSGAPDALSCASSLISCGSGCDDSFDILSCKTTDRLDDFKPAPNGDATSEGGSESSSVTGSGSGRGPPTPRRPPNPKKRVAVSEPNKSPKSKPSPAPRPTQGRAPTLATRERARSRDKAEKPPPPTGPKPAVPPRVRPRATPDTLALVCRESPPLKAKPTKTSTARCRTPGASPSPNGASNATTPRPNGESRTRLAIESKAAFDKYATLPRRRRDDSPESIAIKKDRNGASPALMDGSLYRSVGTLKSRPSPRDRDSPPLRSLPPYPRNRLPSKIKIYHETSVQTALYGTDVENALAGVGIKEIRTDLVLVKKTNKGIQVDSRNKDIERLEAKLRALTETNTKLQNQCREQADKLVATESRLEEERADKLVAQEELQRNTERVLSMLGGESGEGADSLILLESQLQTSANVVMKQQEEISKLHTINRELQQELNRSIKAYRSLESHLEETEQESNELQEFLQTEKSTLQDALRECEETAVRLQREVARSRRECRLLVRISEQRRHEMLAARARLAVTRPAQAAPIALPTLAQRLQSLLQTLILTYSISPDDLEDVIFHNEAFSRSASSDACSPSSPPQPQPPTSLPVPTIPFNNTRFSDDENSVDLLDSETEPCLMMENVLEDVAVPDTYSHNLVSSGLSIMSCPNTVPHNINEDVPLTCPILGTSQPLENRLLQNDNKEDSFSSLHNITTFSADELSPAVPDEKPISEGSYYRDMDTYDLLNMGYSEHDSLQNLSQAILQRQQSEAECSMSEDAVYNNKEIDVYNNTSNSVVDQVILVDNLVAKLLKILKIIQSINCNPIKTKEKSSHKSEEIAEVSDKFINYRLDIHDLTKKLENSSICSDQKIEINAEKKKCDGECKTSEQWCSNHSITSLTDHNIASPQAINSTA